MNDKRNLVNTGAGKVLTKDTGPAVHPADRRFEAVLKGKAARARRPDGPPRVVIALDATTSMGEYLPERKLTIEAARAIAYPMFEKIGPGGLAQVVFFRGADEMQATQWLPNAESLARAIAKVEHKGGWTQHNRALAHVIHEAEKHPIDEVVVISDAFEQRRGHRPNGDILDDAIGQAAQLRALGVNISIGYKGTVRGGCPLDRAGPDAEEAFYQIAKANGGKCFVFNPKKAGAAAKQFGEIAAHAALRVKGDTAGAQVMLEHLQSVPFDMGAVEVDDVVPLRKCEQTE
jgi:hypothetical protein